MTKTVPLLLSLMAPSGFVAPAPEALEPPAFAPVSSRPAPDEAEPAHRSGPVTGSGTLRSRGVVSCLSTGGGSGQFSGIIRFTGTVDVTGPDGVRGRIAVSGFATAGGPCFSGTGNMSGVGPVRGSGTLFKEGRPAGRATVSGWVRMNDHVYTPIPGLSKSISVSGRFEAD